MNADRQLALVVRAYRTLAYVTGTALIVLCFVGIPLQVFADNVAVVKYVGTAHGMLYIIYVVVAFVMTRMVRMKVASPGTVIVLLAGTVGCPWPASAGLMYLRVTHRSTTNVRIGIVPAAVGR